MNFLPKKRGLEADSEAITDIFRNFVAFFIH